MKIISLLSAAALCFSDVRAYVSSPSLVNRRSSCSSLQAATSSFLEEGDTICVVGCTGGVGQIVMNILSEDKKYERRGCSRDVEKAKDLLGSEGDWTQYDIVKDGIGVAKKAIAGSDGVIVCTGTSAFPSNRWQGGSTPEAIEEGNRIIFDAIAEINKNCADNDKSDGKTNGKRVKKVMLVTSIGTTEERRKSFPFLILNAFNVLTSKGQSEQYLKEVSNNGSLFDYLIVRPGRLVGGPWTNSDLSGLLKLDSSTGVKLQTGDVLSGDCNRLSVGKVIMKAMELQSVRNKDFCLADDDENFEIEKQLKQL